MSVTKPINPLTMVERALWSAAEQHAPLATLVKLGNRIRFFDGDPDPGRMNIADSDTPELTLVPVSMTRDFGTSGSVNVKAVWAFQIQSGDSRTSLTNQIKYHLITAMVKTRDELVGLPKVNGVDLVNAEELQQETSPDRGLAGWVAILGVEVAMTLPLYEILETA